VRAGLDGEIGKPWSDAAAYAIELLPSFKLWRDKTAGKEVHPIEIESPIAFQEASRVYRKVSFV
jgi:hypothetical protein